MDEEAGAVHELVKRVVRGAELSGAEDVALDRVLWYEHYVVPHWFIDRHHLTYWNKFTHPKVLPLYYEPLTYVLYWWLDPVKERALADARAANRPVAR